MAFTQAEIDQAVALVYDGNSAPRLSAKGCSETAAQIVQIAKEHNVPICDNPDLVDLLMTLELDDEIPQELYIAIAHILAMAYEIAGKTPEEWVSGDTSRD